MKNQSIKVECDCGCVILKIEKDVDEKILYFVSAYESSFYSSQEKVKSYFKRLWNAITGKEFFLYELVLDEDDFHKFSELEGS